MKQSSNMLRLLSLLVVSGGCSASGGDQGGGSLASIAGTTSAGAGGSSVSSAGSSATSSSGGSGSLVLNVGGSADSGGAGSLVGNGGPETCDGVDNDANGIIDDVDAGHDGICDCLNIATIGHIGPWSNGGNIFAAWLESRSPLGAVELADEQLTPESLRRFQVIVVLHAGTNEANNDGGIIAPAHHPFSDAEVSAFQGWVKGGGGVMTTIGYTGDGLTELQNVNKLLGSVGMGYSTTKMDLTGDIQQWAAHPVSDGITNIFTQNGGQPEDTQGTSIARNKDGKVALQVGETGAGRIAVWGDEWITYDSEWADVEGQQVEHFWLNLLKWLSPPTQCQVPIPPRVK
jgi:hypothetical protein